MGCSAAKNLAVEPINNGTNANGVNLMRKVSTPRKNSDVPPLIGTEPQTEMLENSASIINNLTKTNNGMSFEIAFDDDKEDVSIIKKHPPKRLQKLEEQQQTATDLSLEKLQEKLDEAEIRRQQILQQRVQSAKHRANLKRQATVTSADLDDDEDDGENYLKVPPDVPPLDLNALNGVHS